MGEGVRGDFRKGGKVPPPPHESPVHTETRKAFMELALYFAPQVLCLPCCKYFHSMSKYITKKPGAWGKEGWGKTEASGRVCGSESDMWSVNKKVTAAHELQYIVHMVTLYCSASGSL